MSAGTLAADGFYIAEGEAGRAEALWAHQGAIGETRSARLVSAAAAGRDEPWRRKAGRHCEFDATDAGGDESALIPSSLSRRSEDYAQQLGADTVPTLDRVRKSRPEVAR